MCYYYVHGICKCDVFFFFLFLFHSIGYLHVYVLDSQTRINQCLILRCAKKEKRDWPGMILQGPDPQIDWHYPVTHSRLQSGGKGHTEQNQTCHNNGGMPPSTYTAAVSKRAPVPLLSDIHT